MDDEIKILRSLERRPLTIQDLSYLFTAPEGQIREAVERLVEQGYVISNTSRTLFEYIWPSGQKEKSAVPDPQVAFTLTARGHFRLHPVLSSGDGAAA